MIGSLAEFERRTKCYDATARWREPKFSMTREGVSVCGRCGNAFQANHNLFIMCSDCISKMVYEPGGKYTDVVYGLYTEKDELVYVGVTNDPYRRCHQHFLSKKFGYLKVIKTFSNRTQAEDYEKYSIYSIRPVLNILVERDWSEKPKGWTRSSFGQVLTRKAKKKARAPQRVMARRPPKCPRCGKVVEGSKNKYVGMHDDCLEPSALERRQAERTRQRRAESHRAPNSNKRVNNTTCAKCHKKTKQHQRIYIRDQEGRTGVVHKTCITIKE